ncbi:hypothetical protein Tco_0859559, partial [Tanacetum coccineum]
GEAKTTSTPTSPTTQAQVTYVSESVSYSKFEAKTFKVNEELRKFVGGRLYEGDLQLRQKNHMILSYDVLIIQVNPHRFKGYLKMEVKAAGVLLAREERKKSDKVSVMKILKLIKVARETIRLHLEVLIDFFSYFACMNSCMFFNSYACSDSLLLTPLCCDDIHDVMPRVSALAGCDKFGIRAFGYRELGLYPRRIKEKLTKKQVGGKWILVREMTMISKDGEISEFPEYHSSGEEEPTKQPRALNKYGFVNHLELQRNEFAPHRLPQREGNINGWLMEDKDEPLEHEESDKEVDSDLESTTSSKPKWKKIAKANPNRASCNCLYCSK